MSESPEVDDIVREFLVESYEGLDQLDRDLVALESTPGDGELLARIFRCVHTVKGTCGFLGFGKLESIAHAGENLLSKLRDGELRVTPQLASVLLGLVDAIREIIGNIESSGQEGDADYAALISRLAELLAPVAPASAAPASAPAAEAQLTGGNPADTGDTTGVRHDSDANDSPVLDRPTVLAQGDLDPVAVRTVTGELPAGATRDSQDSGGADAHPDPEFGRHLVEQDDMTIEAIAETRALQEVDDSRTPGDAAAEQTAAKPDSNEGLRVQGESKGVTDSNIRVDVGLLDKLMNLVGELVLARNQVLQHTMTQQDSGFLATSQRLNLITTELQEGVMKTRMQPIGNVWSKFPRVVRDLAAANGKQIRLEMEGKETELDKTIIEAIKDPLTHIVRNSADHGIESPEARRAAGKPTEGCLRLRAFHEGGQVNIEISDDGAGIDPEKVKAKALSMKLITAEQAARMDEREITHLIFLPGFSTAAKVTNVSGRGVGMDVVKTNIEKIGGTVDIQSRQGAGTTLKIKIPLTLAIIPALVVTSGAERYAIPQVNLLELLRLEGEQARKGIEWIHGAPVYRLRGNLLPLAYLNKELKLQGMADNATTSTANPGSAASSEDEAINIVVVQADGRPFGIVVEGINDTEEIVVKPLGKQLKGLTVFAGATIMGDGRVALILDVMGIAQRVNVVSEVRDRSVTDKAVASAELGEARQTLLLFALDEEGGQMAVPLSLVARLEEFPRRMVERAGRQEVVQYREQLLPLIRLDEALSLGKPAEASDPMQVVVYSENGRSMGLVVHRILDIVEETLTIQRGSTTPGVLGSAVVQQRVTDLVDVPAIIRKADPVFYEKAVA